MKAERDLWQLARSAARALGRARREQDRHIILAQAEDEFKTIVLDLEARLLEKDDREKQTHPR